MALVLVPGSLPSEIHNFLSFSYVIRFIRTIFIIIYVWAQNIQPICEEFDE